MKKIKNENELLKEALRVGARYFEARGAGKFESTDHIDMKVRAIYLLLVKKLSSILISVTSFCTYGFYLKLTKCIYPSSLS